MHLNPVEYVIHLFGGVRKLAKAIGKDSSTISKWRKTRGPDGLSYVPSKVIPILLKKAKSMKLDLEPEDFFFGRKIKK